MDDEKSDFIYSFVSELTEKILPHIDNIFHLLVFHFAACFCLCGIMVGSWTGMDHQILTDPPTLSIQLLFIIPHRKTIAKYMKFFSNINYFHKRRAKLDQKNQQTDCELHANCL
jgi:hypothetical protein